LLFRLRRARLRRFEPFPVVSVSDKSLDVSERYEFVQVNESLGLVELGTAGVLPFHLNAFFQTVLGGIAFEFHGQLLIKVDNGFVGEIELKGSSSSCHRNWSPVFRAWLAGGMLDTLPRLDLVLRPLALIVETGAGAAWAQRSPLRRPAALYLPGVFGSW